MKHIPTMHQYQMYAASVMGSLAGVGYYFAPSDKSEFFKMMAYGCAMFLFGKFTNGFGHRRQRATDPPEGEGN